MAYTLTGNPDDDPILGDDGYPHDIEIQRIREWPQKTVGDVVDLMNYVKRRWKYPNYWEEDVIEEYGQLQREYTISTGGWSGNEHLIHALETDQLDQPRIDTWNVLAPYKWQRGGHYVYRLPLHDAKNTP